MMAETAAAQTFLREHINLLPDLVDLKPEVMATVSSIAADAAKHIADSAVLDIPTESQVHSWVLDAMSEADSPLDHGNPHILHSVELPARLAPTTVTRPLHASYRAFGPQLNHLHNTQ